MPGRVEEDFEFAHDEQGEISFPEHEGAAIFQFPGDKLRALVLLNMRERGIRTLVEADDNYLLHPGRDILDRSGWGMEIGEMRHSRQGHRSISAQADGVIVTTRALRDAYAKINPNVYIAPNTIDPQDWPEPEKQDDGIFRIGWVASRSHIEDIPLVTRAFEWASRQPGVEVCVAGLNPHWKFPHGFLPWVDDLADYRKIFAYFDVGVAPIRGLPFALYRSDVKALEISMGLGCPVLSDVAPYATFPDDCAIKVSDAKGFLRAIQHLVRHQDEARQMAQAAREYVLAERTTEKQIHRWEAAIDPH